MTQENGSKRRSELKYSVLYSIFSVISRMFRRFTSTARSAIRAAFLRRTHSHTCIMHPFCRYFLSQGSMPLRRALSMPRAPRELRSRSLFCFFEQCHAHHFLLSERRSMCDSQIKQIRRWLRRCSAVALSSSAQPRCLVAASTSPIWR